MAESIVQFVLSKLADAAVQEFLHLCGVDKQVKLVNDELGWIQAFLKDADRQQDDEDERQRHWVKELREVAYDIEDAIDKACILGIMMKKCPSKIEAVKRWFKSPKIISALHELGVEINEILERIKQISESRETYGTNNLGDGSGGHMELPVKRLLVADFDDPDVVGFDADKDNIVEQLLDDSTKRRRVVSIVGPGGLGKTTLARKSYNSGDVKMKFDLRMWITISKKFKLVDILINLVEQLRNKPIHQDEKEKRAEYFLTELHKSLKNKSYLVVLDDVWTNDLWIQIEEALPNKNNGSRVLMTTRFLDVAKTADAATDPYQLKFLTDESSLQLLLKKALPNNQTPDRNLSDVAKQFVEKCGGLPLALVVLGGLLSKQSSNWDTWSKVMQTMNWQADASKVLATSYEDLPFSLKLCFMYFASFPEDYKIEAKPLIRMWVAEGFIPQVDIPGTTMEDTAENFLEDLVQRSMIQASERGRDGSILYCHIHDLLHDIAIKKAREDNFLMVCSNPDDQESCGGARRVAVHHAMHFEEEIKEASPNLRSLLSFDKLPNCSRHGELKVLVNIICTDPKAFMHSDFYIYKKKDRKDKKSYNVYAPLRYLQLNHVVGLHYSYFLQAPNFLQTLDLRGHSRVTEIDDNIWRIKTLRHVLLSGHGQGPPPLVDLRDLQTLIGVKPRESWELEGLPNLPSLRELDMRVDDGFPLGVIVSFIGALKHLVFLRMYTQLEPPMEILNICKRVRFVNFIDSDTLY